MAAHRGFAQSRPAPPIHLPLHQPRSGLERDRLQHLPDAVAAERDRQRDLVLLAGGPAGRFEPAGRRECQHSGDDGGRWGIGAL